MTDDVIKKRGHSKKAGNKTPKKHFQNKRENIWVYIWVYKQKIHSENWQHSRTKSPVDTFSLESKDITGINPEQEVVIESSSATVALSLPLMVCLSMFEQDYTKAGRLILLDSAGDVAWAKHDSESAPIMYLHSCWRTSSLSECPSVNRITGKLSAPD